MRTSPLSLTISALALTLAAPALALAKAPSTHAFPAVSHTASHPIHHVTTGVIDTTTNGSGTYKTVVTGTAKDKTIKTTDDFANGKVVTSTDVVIKNANDTTTSDTVTDLANGGVITRDVVISQASMPGDYTISGIVTQANGAVDTVSATRDATAYGNDTVSTLTNSKDQTESLNNEFLKTSNASANVVTGTGFNGQAIDYASLRVANTGTPANTVDTTINGQGVYSIGSGTANGTTTVYNNRVFADGASSATVNAITDNANGSTTYDRTIDTVNSNATTSSITTDETYTSNGSGSNAISGTFAQSNDHNGTVTGSESNTNYGSDTMTTLTDQNGATRVADTQTLVAGKTVLNINTGTTFTGQVSDSVGLIAAK